MEKTEKKRKEKEKGVEGREECIEACRRFPNTTWHPFCTCLQVAAGSIGKGAHCACVREGLDHTCTHLLHFKVSTRFGENIEVQVGFQNFNLQNRLPADLLPGGDTRYCLSCVVWRCRCLIIYLYIAQGCFGIHNNCNKIIIIVALSW